MLLNKTEAASITAKTRAKRSSLLLPAIAIAAAIAVAGFHQLPWMYNCQQTSIQFLNSILVSCLVN